MDEVDDKFYPRADEHINLSNAQIDGATPGKVSASMLYATARFNAWWTACGFDSSEDMQSKRQENIDYFVDQFRLMLEENMDEYISKFDSYMERN